MLQVKNIFADLLRIDKGLPNITMIFVFLFLALSVGFSIYFEFDLYVMAGFASLPILFIILTYPKIWIYSVVLLFTLFFAKTDDDLNFYEVVIALVYNAGLYLWIFWSVFVSKRKLVRNIADWIILFLFVLLLFGNSAIAVMNGVDFTTWLREYVLFTLTLFYFPIREHFSEKKDLIKLLIVLAVAIFIVDFRQFYSYYYGITSDDIQYAYELGKSVRINQTVFTIASIFGFLFAFNQSKKKNEYLIFIFTAITIVALITSFSRTFWVIQIFALIMMFFFLPSKQKAKLSLYLTILSVSLISIGYIVAQDNMSIFFKYAEQRLTSSTKGKKDISLQSRLSEWRSVFHDLEYKWLSGNGFAKEFSFYNPISSTTKHTSIIHNGYIYFIYRMGIPLTLMYLFFFSYYFYKSFLLLKLTKDPFFKVLIVATFGSILAMYIINITSSQFMYRDGLFTVAFLVAFTGIAEINYIKSKNE